MRGKAFLNWKRSIDLFSSLLLRYRGNANYYKSIHSTCGNREDPVNFQNKSVNYSPFNLVFAKTEGERETFFGRVQEGGPQYYHLVDTSKR